MAAFIQLLFGIKLELFIQLALILWYQKELINIFHECLTQTGRFFPLRSGTLKQDYAIPQHEWWK